MTFRLRCDFDDLEARFLDLDDYFKHPVIHRDTSWDTLVLQA